MSRLHLCHNALHFKQPCSLFEMWSRSTCFSFSKLKIWSCPQWLEWKDFICLLCWFKLISIKAVGKGCDVYSMEKRRITHDVVAYAIREWWMEIRFLVPPSNCLCGMASKRLGDNIATNNLFVRIGGGIAKYGLLFIVRGWGTRWYTAFVINVNAKTKREHCELFFKWFFCLPNRNIFYLQVSARTLMAGWREQHRLLLEMHLKCLKNMQINVLHFVFATSGIIS